MELNTINNPNSKINAYVTESLKGILDYLAKMKFGVSFISFNCFKMTICIVQLYVLS